MFAGDDDVTNACGLGGSDPGLGIELYRVETARELFVFGHWNMAVIHDPFTNAIHRLAVPLPRRHGIKAPVNEHAETGLAEPGHPLVSLFFGLRSGGVGCALQARWQSARQEQRRENEQLSRVVAEFDHNGVDLALYFDVATLAASISSQNLGFCWSASSSWVLRPDRKKKSFKVCRFKMRCTTNPSSCRSK